MSSQAQLVQGSTLKISTAAVESLTSPATPLMADLSCLTREVNVQGGQATDIDTTALCSVAKETMLGLVDNGTVSINGYFKIGDAGHEALKAAAADKALRLLRIDFPNGSSWAGTVRVQQKTFALAVDGVVSASYNLRISGPTAESAPTS